MKKIIDWLKKAWAVIVSLWGKFLVIANKSEFIFGYPLAVLTVVVVCTYNILAVLAVVVWCITILVNSREE
jgi:hypothetical protein